MTDASEVALELSQNDGASVPGGRTHSPTHEQPRTAGAQGLTDVDGQGALEAPVSQLQEISGAYGTDDLSGVGMGGSVGGVGGDAAQTIPSPFAPTALAALRMSAGKALHYTHTLLFFDFVLFSDL